ncbi:uncharacterized protein KY384_001499 [Bacidia gigantensis]|uniref:uncharacterized protein n=1 Tax=Bacidia gigantensis TaxID=2732470 RepID=UPI001D04F01F|nr:uncharacterized protein KY384_001499 [Bacidia gigantensis]KAG8533758.1 hypothetical protein KY384_001499 [Bacidia gigantensis]
MAGRYVPPALRNRNLASAPASQSGKAVESTAARRPLSELKLSPDRNDRPLHTLQEIAPHYGDNMTHSTLHDSAKTPGMLSYVVLFHGANPRWYSDHIIFARTNISFVKPFTTVQHDHLEAKPGGLEASSRHIALRSSHSGGEVLNDPDKDTSAESPSDVKTSILSNSEESPKPHLIPVFLEAKGRPSQGRSAVFYGYFSILHVDFLEPQSPELVRMLEQKWSPSKFGSGQTRRRSPERWADSLRQEWVVIQMTEVLSDHTPGDPVIQAMKEEHGKENAAMWQGGQGGRNEEATEEGENRSHEDNT